MEKITFKAIKVIFGLTMALIIGLICFFQDKDYFCKVDFVMSNMQIMFMLAVMIFMIILLSYITYRKRKSYNSKQHMIIDFERLVRVLTIVLFIGQVYVFYNVFFLAGWDVGVVRELSNKLVFGPHENLEYYENYFSIYPNNLFIVFLTAFILKINSVLGVFSGDYAMMSCVVVNCVINTAACYLVYRTATLFVEKKIAFAGYCLAIMLIGISPWTVIFYSDALGVIIPILSFYLYVRPSQKRWIKYVYRFLALLTAVIGYFVKPQCAIMLIAIVIIECVQLINLFTLDRIKKLFLIVCVSVLCFFTINQTIDATCEKIGFKIDQNKSFGMSHFLMMGLNESRGGVYSEEDVVFSRSFGNREERTKANIEKSIERIREMGISGLVEHAEKKMLTTFNDGTFAWGQEGGFYAFVPTELNSRMAPFLRSIYCGTGLRTQCFFVFAQMVWLSILLLSTCSCLVKSNTVSNKRIYIIWLAILGLIGFELLFEVRARYLYIYAPVFCLLATVGMERVAEGVNSKIIWMISKRGV